MYFNIFDAIIFHFMLILLAKNLYISIIILVSLIFFIIKNNRYDDIIELKSLGKLSEFKDKLESGQNPINAYNKIFEYDYPKYFLNPKSPKFSYQIFVRQYNLFEKKVLLEQELKSNFVIIKFRMMLMKYIPIILMYVLSAFIDENGSNVIKGILILVFIISYYYSDRLIK